MSANGGVWTAQAVGSVRLFWPSVQAVRCYPSGSVHVPGGARVNVALPIVRGNARHASEPSQMVRARLNHLSHLR